MDATLQRVDKAVDEGHKIVEKHQKVNFQARQVGLSPTAQLFAQTHSGPCQQSLMCRRLSYSRHRTVGQQALGGFQGMERGLRDNQPAQPQYELKDTIPRRAHPDNPSASRRNLQQYCSVVWQSKFSPLWRSEEATVTPACMQGANALPEAAGQVAGSTTAEVEGRGQRRKDQWLEAQTATGQSRRPQDEYGWQVDNSDGPFKGLLDHWRGYVQVGC